MIQLSSGSTVSRVMQRSKWPVALGGALLLYALYQSQISQNPSSPTVQPAPRTPAKPAPKPRQPEPRCPHCPLTPAAGGRTARHAPELGGLTSPDGASACILSMPTSENWPKNISSCGFGCCGYRALAYCARMQGVSPLVDWPEKLRADGVPGGAYPEKVDELLRKYAPSAGYFQDTSKSHAIIAACVASQRGCAVDYSGNDPHYSGRIAHCVTVLAFDQENDWVAILDNNYPDIDNIVWMSVVEFDKRWSGWVYGLLAQTPGEVRGHNGGESWDFFPGKDGVTNYGFGGLKKTVAGYCRLNGENATVAAILDALGPAMAPIRVDVDHRVEPLKLDFSPLQLALAGGAVLALWSLTRKENV